MSHWHTCSAHVYLSAMIQRFCVSCLLRCWLSLCVRKVAYIFVTGLAVSWQMLLTVKTQRLAVHVWTLVNAASCLSDINWTAVERHIVYHFHPVQYIFDSVVDTAAAFLSFVWFNFIKMNQSFLVGWCRGCHCVCVLLLMVGGGIASVDGCGAALVLSASLLCHTLEWIYFILTMHQQLAPIILLVHLRMYCADWWPVCSFQLSVTKFPNFFLLDSAW